MSVEYRDIPGFPGYRVGDDGTVWSRRNPRGGLRDDWKHLNPTAEKQHGYCKVHLRRGGGSHKRYVHALVLEAFVGPRQDGMEACHGDGVRHNNALGNLRWDTRLANHADKIRHGTTRRGESNPHSVLTEQEVLELVDMRAAIPDATLGDLAAFFGVPVSTAQKVLNGENWSWLTGIEPGSPTLKHKRPGSRRNWREFPLPQRAAVATEG